MSANGPAQPADLAERTILITGGAGFLGVHLAQELVACRARVILQDTAVKRTDLLGPVLRSGRATFVVCSLAELEQSPALLNQLERLDFHVHVGLSLPEAHATGNAQAAFLTANVAPLERLLGRLPAGLKGVCLASTLEVYGDFSPEPLAETAPVRAERPIAAAKLAMEQALLGFGRSCGVPATVLRLGTLYGPGQVHSARTIPSCIRNLLVCQSPVIYGDGGDVHDHVFVRDAARALRLALGRVETAPGIYNVGTGHGWTTRAVVEMAQRLLKVQLPPKHMPAQGPRQCLVADPSLAQAHLGFSAEYQLEAGLQQEIEYHRACLLEGAEAFWAAPASLAASGAPSFAP